MNADEARTYQPLPLRAVGNNDRFRSAKAGRVAPASSRIHCQIGGRGTAKMGYKPTSMSRKDSRPLCFGARSPLLVADLFGDDLISLDAICANVLRINGIRHKLCGVYVLISALTFPLFVALAFNDARDIDVG